MEMIHGQLMYVAASFLSGLILMAVYDGIRAFRRLVRHGRCARFVEDWLFWAVSAVVVFQMIFALNNGILRSFFVLASAGGMLLWRKLAGDHIVRAITAVVRLIVRPFARVRMWLRKSKTDSIKKT